jgi:hypothetical protein
MCSHDQMEVGAFWHRADSGLFGGTGAWEKVELLCGPDTKYDQRESVPMRRSFGSNGEK